MDYSLYEPEDFAANESYLRYYFRLDPVDVFFWQNWISNHPEKLDVIISADQLISFAAMHLPEEEYQQEVERLHRALASSEQQQAPAPQTTTHSRLTRLFAVAGVVAGLLVAVAFFVHHNTHNAKESAAVLAAGVMQEKANNGLTPLTVRLEDNSTVTLGKGARLLYPKSFSGDKREVYLEGDAFFDVSHDADRPFYVYYNKLVTHVLGTSFHISTDALRKQVEVTVRSGKVEVYEKAAAQKRPARNAASNGVILTPNQKVRYSEDSRQFEALLVDEPLPLVTVAPAADSLQADDIQLVAPEIFVFSTAPLPHVLQVFEKVYGIEIEVENERINNCHFSGDMSNMGFNARMEAICQVLHTTYEIRGTKILIRGNGCPD
jgi:ferric-dicitrate binding protein FerR (iron transport regulator)